MIASAIVTRELVKVRGKSRALDGLTLSVPRGSILGLVGENGAGKTTWMMCVAGLLAPDAGTLDLLGDGPFDAARHGGRVAILPQDSELPLEMTPRAALFRFARLQGLRAQEARLSAEQVLRAVNLSARADVPVRTLSHGMRKRVMVAQCFVGRPEIVLLDEPLNGLDPVEADRLRKFILSRRGRCTLVISSHHLEDVEKLCTHVALMAGGRLKKFDTLDALTHDTGRIVYELTAPPADMKALEAAWPGASFEWCAGEKRLVCTLDTPEPSLAAVNQALLPVLLAQTGVLSVSRGQTLAEAFLGMPQK
jgi:ABC-type multidrug transport system ATPase subunit